VHLTFQFTLPFAPAIYFPLVVRRNRARFRRAVEEGRCTNCGYDPSPALSPGHSGVIKCPECGLHTVFPLRIGSGDAAKPTV